MKIKLPDSIFIAAHVSPIYGPVQALVRTLESWKANFRFVALPFGYSGMRGANSQDWQQGEALTVLNGHPAKGPELLLWIKDFIFVLKRGIATTKKYELFIGVDNLNALAGLVLRRLGKVERVVYYVIDYTPVRFKNPLLNAIYHWVDRRAVHGSDAVWNLSERMR